MYTNFKKTNYTGSAEFSKFVPYLLRRPYSAKITTKIENENMKIRKIFSTLNFGHVLLSRDSTKNFPFYKYFKKLIIYRKKSHKREETQKDEFKFSKIIRIHEKIIPILRFDCNSVYILKKRNLNPLTFFPLEMGKNKTKNL